MNPLIKYGTFTLLYFLGIGVSQAHMHTKDTTTHARVTALAAQIAKTYAPDRRTARFDIEQDEKNPSQYQIETTDAEAKINFLAQAKQHNLQATFSFNLLPDTTVGPYSQALVNLSVANVRSEPRNPAELATQVLLGAKVDLLKKRSGYFLIRTPEGYLAWVNGSSLTPMSTEEIAQRTQAKRVIFIDDFGHSYSQPNTASLRVSDLVMGNILQTSGQQQDFYEVRYPDDRVAYIPKQQVRDFDEWVAQNKASAEQVIQVAQTMMGLPYLWGGTSGKGVDCSGLTKTAYFMNGIIIPRDASQQVLAGQAVDILTNGDLDPQKALQNLKPADLIFFASAKATNPNARVTHVAIYLGDGKFIHSSGTVRINSMLADASDYDDYHTRTIVSARRYLDVQDELLPTVANHWGYF